MQVFKKAIFSIIYQPSTITMTMHTLAPPLELTGLTPAPAQVCGSFRLVPLLRAAPCEDVRLTRHAMPAGVKVVDLPDATKYTAFVPHALRLSWGTALGGQVLPQDTAGGWRCVEGVDKLRKREGPDALRFLPLHLALEGLLALHFSPPDIQWAELSAAFHRNGLGTRSESGVPGALLPRYDEALRTFELHRGQVGMLVFVADALASAFVVPSPADYLPLHRTLLGDLYGELLLQYAVLYPHTPTVQATPDFAGATSLADLRAGLDTMRREWADYTHRTMLGDWLERPLRTETVYKPAHLRLERFLTDLDPTQANHIGERLLRKNGEVLYLKTFHLSAAQTRRAYLLSQLAAHGWNLQRAALALNTTVPDLIGRVEAQGFGYLLTQGVRERAVKARR